jgi:hypothetical protein
VSQREYGLLLGHIHNQGTQKDGLMKKRMERTILDFYYIFYFMIIVDWYMTIIKVMSFNIREKSNSGLDII